MKALYEIAGISKQALWKYSKGQQQQEHIICDVVEAISDMRQRHKQMGCRTIYHSVSDAMAVGRDRFEQIGFSNGFKLKLKRSPVRTTWSQKVEVYPNLVEGMGVNNINQVWQSDIFYLMVEGQHYYGVTIEDIYSRKLLSLHISKSLSAKQLEAALKKAIKSRRGNKLKGCIFHSDRGSQYISKLHKALLAAHGMRISMCKMPQENAYVERIQGTLKNQYLYPHEPTVKNIGRLAGKVMRYYNRERPHQSLGMMTPEEYERLVENLLKKDRPVLKVYQGFSGLSTQQHTFQQKEKRSKKEKVNYNNKNFN